MRRGTSWDTLWYDQAQPSNSRGSVHANQCVQEIGFITAGLIAATILIFSYKRVNAKRERQVAAGEHNGYTPEELSDLGDKAPTFRYTL